MYIMESSIAVGAPYSYTKFKSELSAYEEIGKSGLYSKLIEPFAFIGSPDILYDIPVDNYASFLPDVCYGMKVLVIRRTIPIQQPNARLLVEAYGYNGDPTQLNFRMWPYFQNDMFKVDRAINDVCVWMGIVAENDAEKFSGVRWHLDGGTVDPSEWQVNIYFGKFTQPIFPTSGEIFVKTRPGTGLEVLVANSNLPSLIGAH